MKPYTMMNAASSSKRCAILVVVFWITFFTGSASGGWDEYKPATLSATIAKYEPGCKDLDVPMNYCLVPIQKMRVRAVFLGNVRDIGAERSTYLKMWEKTFGIDPAFINRFEKEIQVQEGEKTYWLPIQTVLIDPLKKEVSSNGHALLYVGFIGTTNQEWIFLINEFEAQ